MNASILTRGAEPLVREAPDILSQVLSRVRLRGETVVAGVVSETDLSGYDGLPRFYVLEEGRLAVDIASVTVWLAPGDVALLPHGNGHVLTPIAGDTHPFPPARFVVGIFHLDVEALPSVLGTLPAVIHVPASGPVMPPWLAAIAHFLVEEATTPAPGSSLMVSRLIDLLVIRALRSWAMQSGENCALLSALGDERLGRALSALHADPVRGWTVPELAATAAMSRSSFAKRFTAVLGEPPLHYLARWRLNLAREMLRSGTARVGEVAMRTGYTSDAAFSRAFKTRFGHPPKQALVANTLDGRVSRG